MASRNSRSHRSHRARNNSPVNPASIVQPGQHYGVPLRPYVRGKAAPLTLCEACECFMPPTHDCSGEPVTD